VVVAPRRGMQPAVTANSASISLRPARASTSAALPVRLRSSGAQFATPPSTGRSGHSRPQGERAKASTLSPCGRGAGSCSEPGEGRKTPLRMSEAIRRVSRFDAGFTGRCVPP
jgi:hypothetical protein